MREPTIGESATAPANSLQVLQVPEWLGIAGLIHGFSTRQGGVSSVYGDGAAADLNLGFTPHDDRASVLANRELFVQQLLGTGRASSARLVTLPQVHSNRVHVVRSPGPTVDSGDGMITDEAGLLLAIQTADCVPVLIVDRARHAVGAVHAGWRGTVQRIVEVAVEAMQSQFGSRREDLSAAIGPHIGACCYQVGEEVRQAFAERFRYADALFTDSPVGEAASTMSLNLAEANRRQLLDAGIARTAIHSLHPCTSCHPEQFFSHRKTSGRTGRMMSVIGFRAGAY